MDALLCNSWLVLCVSDSDECVGSDLVKGPTQMFGASRRVQGSGSSAEGEDGLQRRVRYNTLLLTFICALGCG